MTGNLPRSVLCLIVAMILAGVGLQAQSVSVQLFQPPPNQLRASDLWRLNISNLGSEPVTLYLRGIVTEARDGEVVVAESATFELAPREFKRVTARDISPIKRISSIKRYEDAFLRTGTVPSGDYEVCVFALLVDNGERTEEELGSDCFSQLIEQASSLMLVMPDDEAEVSESLPMFTWMPPVPLPRGSRIKYSLKVYEIFGKQTAFDATLKNPLHFKRENIGPPNLLYPVSARPFEDGRRYAWMVEAFGAAGAADVRLSASEVWSFRKIPGDTLAEEDEKKSKPAASTKLIAAGMAHSLAVASEPEPFVLGKLALRPGKLVLADQDKLQPGLRELDNIVLPQRKAQRANSTGKRAIRAEIDDDKENGLNGERAILSPAAGDNSGSYTPGYDLDTATFHEIYARQLEGDLWSWGLNDERQLGNSGEAFNPSPAKLDIKDAIALACGMGHSLIVRKDGSVWSWGFNDYGQLGIGTLSDKSQPGKISGLSSIIAVAAGARHSLALKLAAGTVYSWGYNRSGELGIGSREDQASPQIVMGLPACIDLAAGNGHSLALTQSGQVYAWGSNYYGQCAHPAKNYILATPRLVPGLRNVVAIGAGDHHSLALTRDGSVWAWGNNASGQLGFDPALQSDSSAVRRITALSDVVDIAAHGVYSIALRRDSTVWLWGNNYLGTLANGSRSNSWQPVKVPTIAAAVAVAGGGSHVFALRSDGSLMAWGDNTYGQLGRGSSREISSDWAEAPNLPDAVLYGSGQ